MYDHFRELEVDVSCLLEEGLEGAELFGLYVVARCLRRRLLHVEREGAQPQAEGERDGGAVVLAELCEERPRGLEGVRDLLGDPVAGDGDGHLQVVLEVVVGALVLDEGPVLNELQRIINKIKKNRK